jgi:Tol biopolymer transport system component
MDASGFNQHCLTSNPTNNRRPNSALPEDVLPAWSPDSQQLAFVSTRDHPDQRGQRDQVYLMNADGSHAINLTQHLSLNTDPAIAQDFSQIAFVSNRSGGLEIFLMAPDGSHIIRLTNAGVDAIQPKWQPNGTLATFAPLTATPTGTIRTLVPLPNGGGVGFVITDTPVPTATLAPPPTNTPRNVSAPPPPPPPPPPQHPSRQRHYHPSRASPISMTAGRDRYVTACRLLCRA